MSLTGTGIVIILLGVYALFLNRTLLYDLTIFFVPFSATSVINFGEEGTGSAIQPYMFLGSLWLLTVLLPAIFTFKKNTLINKTELTNVLLLIGFALIALISLSMPIIINGSEMGNITGGLGLNGPIVFSSKNITQFVYLLFGVIFAIALYLHNKSEQNYLRTIKVYSIAILFVVIWGFLELFCYYKNITYPAFLFNNSFNGNAAGYKMVADASSDLKRISSVGIEPSIMIQSVVVLIPFLFFGIINKQYIFNKWFDLVFIFLLYIFTIRSTSSSGILCLIFLTILSGMCYFNKLNLKIKIRFLLGSIVIIPVLTILIYNLFTDIINKMLFDKTESFSELERLSSILDAWNTFLRHPVLGAGWASVSSFDLFVKILSNTGILGFLFFVGYIVNIIRSKIKPRNLSPKITIINTAILVAFCTMIFGNMINTFTFIFGSIWLICGLAMVSKYCHNHSPISESI